MGQLLSEKLNVILDSKERAVLQDVFDLFLNSEGIGIELAKDNVDAVIISGACSDDGIQISGACTDNGIEISGTCTEAAIDIQGTQTAAGLLISGTAANGVQITGTQATAAINISAECTADGIVIAGACGSNGIEISGACTDKGILISGATAYGVMVNGAFAVGFDLQADGNIGFRIGPAFSGTVGFRMQGSATNGIEISGNCSGSAISLTGTMGVDITFPGGATMANSGGGLTFTVGCSIFVGDVNVSGTNELFFGSRGSTIADHSYIKETADGDLTVYAHDVLTLGASSIAHAGGYGPIRCHGYLQLLNIDVDGSTEGSLWFDDSEDTLKFYGNSTVTTLCDSVHDFLMAGRLVNSGGMVVTGTNVLYFGSYSGLAQDNCYIAETSDGELKIYAHDRLDLWSDSIPHSGSYGAIRCFGYVQLLNTAVDGDTDGQIWYDTASNKIQGRANGATVDLH